MRPTFAVIAVPVLLGIVLTPHRPGFVGHHDPVTVGQTYCLPPTPCVLTYHNDGNRDGVNPNETVLQASTLGTTATPTPQWMGTADGQIYGQPLYVHGLALNGAAKNVVYAATENNSVYAWDSDSANAEGTVLANVNLNNAGDLGSGYTEIAVPWSDMPSCGGPVIQPEVGITGTPVIDASVTPPVMYLVSKHEDIDPSGNKTYRQKLHALQVDTLQELPGSPLVLDTTFATNSAPGFDPLKTLQRAALALVPTGNGSSQVWVSWGAFCDGALHYGFEMAFTYNYTAADFLNSYNVFNPEAGCAQKTCIGGIWMGGAAPAVDASGNVYLAVGNGGDVKQGTTTFDNSVVRLNGTGLQDYYSPPDYNALNNGHTTVACTNPNPLKCPSPCKFDSTGQYCQLTLTTGDLDLGSGGVVLLSPSFRLNNPEIVAAGKQGMVYVVFSGNMGHIDSQAGNPTEYACTTAAVPTPGAIAQCFAGLPGGVSDTDRGSRGAPAFLSASSGKTQYNYLYFTAISDSLRVFNLQNKSGVGVFNTNAATPESPHKFLFPGASPSVTWNSAQGSNVTNAIVWAIDGGTFGTFTNRAGAAVLYAYRAIPTEMGAGGLGTELWDTSVFNSTLPGNPGAVKFIVPTIADGKIFVGGGAQGYLPDSANCPTPTATVQPTSCGALTMYK
ncbi:MAG TPA: hypothetical protein VMX38_22955 [Verrucomicrobiae bacterium]|nr:hypothetical protein [Verrucomicrobiae bacterium]